MSRGVLGKNNWALVLLILVGVVVDTLQQIESHLMMRHYDGLLNSGHVRSNRNAGVSAY